jgi:DASS family divalent anion:Na+ symporter
MAGLHVKASSPADTSTSTPPIGHLGNLWKYLVPVGIGIVLWFLPPPDGLEAKAWHMFAVFVATIAGIMTAPLPMAAVAIIGSTVGVLVGVVSFADVTKSTGTDLVWLVMLAFFISRGVIKTGLGRRIALLFMRLLGKRTVGLGYGLALTELIISPAMPSITARAGGVMLPITRAISEVLGSHANDPETRGKVGRYLILCAFHANIISAGMFITAMAGNPLAVKLAADQGVSISWLDWAVAASVPGLLCLAIPIAMLWIAPPEVRQTPDATALAQRELTALGPISAKEIIMAVI